MLACLLLIIIWEGFGINGITKVYRECTEIKYLINNEVLMGIKY